MTRKSRPDLSQLVGRAQENVQAIEQSEAQRAPIQYLPVSALQPSPFQARRDFSTLTDLVEDVKANGVLQPILVRPVGSGYEIVAGERRWRASREAGKPHIPAVVRAMSDHEAREFGLRENLQRENLNAYELAQAILEWTAERLGRPRAEIQAELGQNMPPESTVEALLEALHLVGRDLTLKSYQRNYLSLLRLPTHLVEAIERGASYSAVLALRSVSPQQQQEWLPKVLSGEWSRRQVQQAVQAAKVSIRATEQAGKAPQQDNSTEQETGWTRQWRNLGEKLTPETQRHLSQRKRKRVEALLAELEELLGESSPN